MNENDNNTYESGVSEEQEQAQVNALIQNANAVAAVQAALAKQRSQPSLSECEDCGEDIPEQRRLAMRGITRCIYCQGLFERKQKGL
jgi:phage/conjugal plasmid C-4 type zinc finger TraR family protein